MDKSPASTLVDHSTAMALLCWHCDPRADSVDAGSDIAVDTDTAAAAAVEADHGDGDVAADPPQT